MEEKTILREPKSYSCEYCQYEHSLSSRVELHTNRLHYGHRQPYSCRLCYLKTHSIYLINRHRLIAHKARLCTMFRRKLVGTPVQTGAITLKPKLTVEFSCGRCGFNTLDRDNWGRHINQHAKDQIKQLQELSPRPAPRKKEPTLTTSTSNTDSSFSCSECDFTCRRKDMYTAHVKQHSKKALVSKCDLCPYTTSNPYNLMKHKRTHTGEKPFKCSYCTYRSADSGNLNKHIYSHHRKEGATRSRSAVIMMKKKKSKKSPSTTAVSKPYEPPLSVPVALTTPAPYQPPPPKMNPAAVVGMASGSIPMLYKCTECDYQCANEEFLVAHLSIHKKLGDQYVCAICEYASRNQQNLAKHIRTHTGEKPYQCKHCNYSAADKGNLNKHVKTHHKKEEEQRMAEQTVIENPIIPISWMG